MNNLKVYDDPAASHDPGYIRSTEPLTKSQSAEQDDESPTSSYSEETRRSSTVREILSNWRLMVIVATPILLLPILVCLPGDPVAKCAYILILMAIYWCTEALPLPATALMPMFLAPMVGLMSAKAIAINYLQDLNFLFVGGLIFAVAIEKWNLHKRIALGVLIVVGTQPKMLLLGFISVTGFLSMWLSNTATTAMMIPIAHAVLVEMWKQRSAGAVGESYQMEESFGSRESQTDDRKLETDERTGQATEKEVKPGDMNSKYQNLGKAMSLAVCYGANIGGTGTLTGTGPNLIIGQVMEKYFPDSNDITYGSWMLFSIPLMLLCLAICWVILVLVFLGPRSVFCCQKDEEFEGAGGRQVLRREYRKLGKIRFPEIVLIVFFVVLVMLWLWRDPKFTKGWSVIFTPGYMTDAATGLFVCSFLFAFPSSVPGIKSHRTGYKLGPPLLDLPSVHTKLPWGVIILLGGGFALANMCKTSGLSDWLGCNLGALDQVHPAALVFICGAVMTLFTEFTSNTSSASIFLPILAQLAVKLRMHPLYLLIPVTICSSFAFAFPVATPPNAIVFAFGYLKVTDMVKAGMLMNLLCLLCVTLAINTWGTAYFNLQSLPDWVNINSTDSSCQ